MTLQYCFLCAVGDFIKVTFTFVKKKELYKNNLLMYIYIYIYIHMYIYTYMYMYTIYMYVMYSFWLVLFLTILVKSGEKVTSSYEPTGHWQKCFFLSIRFCETRKDSPGVPNWQMFVWLHTIWWYMFSWPLFIY